jgi:hypothetical protein
LYNSCVTILLLIFLKDYVDEIYDAIVDAILGKKLEKEIKELKNETPPRMSRMHEKQPRSDATRKKKHACQLLMCHQQILVGCMCLGLMIFNRTVKNKMFIIFFFCALLCL